MVTVTAVRVKLLFSEIITFVLIRTSEVYDTTINNTIWLDKLCVKYLHEFNNWCNVFYYIDIIVLTWLLAVEVEMENNDMCSWMTIFEKAFSVMMVDAATMITQDKIQGWPGNFPFWTKLLNREGWFVSQVRKGRFRCKM